LKGLGLKAVGESVQKPLDYYEHNVAGSLALCQAMARHPFQGLALSHWGIAREVRSIALR
jgi:UDP-glucose 4-epimerase